MTYFEDYRFKHGRTVVVDEEGNQIDFCQEVRVIRSFFDLETKALFVGIAVKREDGTTLYREYPRSAIVDDPITTLADLGLSVAPVKEYAITISEILFDTERSARKEYRHCCLGFRETKKGRVFLLKDAVGADITSTYCERKLLRSRGSFAKWREGIVAHVGNRVELQLALAIGASAPVAAMLKKLSLLDGAAVFALIGESSSGKSSALKLMASIWGKPSVSDGIIDSFVNTETYFFSQLGQKNGFPHFVDETSAQPGIDLTTLVYNVSLGKERGRCKPDGTPRPRKKWAGTVVFTGENSLFQQTNCNKGLFARLVEFSFPWTADAESAEALARFIADQYGTAAVPLIEKILTMRDGEVEALFDKVLSGLVAQFKPQNGVERRIMCLYAIILISASIASEAWDIPFDLAGILRLLQEHHDDNEAVKDRTLLVCNCIKQQILANWAKFPENATKYDASIWGERDKYRQQQCVWIVTEHLHTFLKSAGEHNAKTALSSLYKKGCLAKFGDRFKKPHKIAGVTVDCYCLLLQIPSTTPALPTFNSSSAQINKLLESNDDED